MSQSLTASTDEFVYLAFILGLGSGRAPHEDHMCGDHDGTELVAQESIGTGKKPILCIHLTLSRSGAILTEHV